MLIKFSHIFKALYIDDYYWHFHFESPALFSRVLLIKSYSLKLYFNVDRSWPSKYRLKLGGGLILIRLGLLYLCGGAFIWVVVMWALDIITGAKPVLTFISMYYGYIEINVKTGLAPVLVILLLNLVSICILFSF